MNKYGAKKTKCLACAGFHPSKAEAKRCGELHLMHRAGLISQLEREPQYWFADMKHPSGHRVGYKPDFQYVEDGKKIVEDVKGFSARDFALRAACFRYFHPDIELRVIK